MLGREATDAEIADYTGLDYEVVRKTRMEHHEGLITSLDEGAGDDESGAITRKDTVPDETSERPLIAAHRDAVKRVLAESIGTLSEKERLVVSLMYFEDFAQRDIARILSVSDSRVSQIHTAAINKLRGKLERLKEDLLAEEE
jgi:RNA polymerase sigma factor for flagellar operon FliA